VADPLSITQSAYAAFGRGDIPAVLESFDDNVEWVLPDTPGVPIGGTHRGKQAVAQWFQKLAQEMEFHTFEPRQWIASGDKVVVLIHSEATVKSTGKRLVDDLCHVHTVRNDKLVHFREWDDTLAAQEAFRK
jgi:ketosteroid isomerase-like protein